ncbi:hypothetical protein BR93DRAFT_957311 [Coniochaeta sp. PMI_546]|nr:hypothetical protein BR93DRAFT_957311 [Coniochaeta sp. PMI_546]
MKWNNLIILALLDLCAAKSWKFFGCEDWNKNGELTKALVEAVTLAGTARDVLTNSLNDEKVQSMIKVTLGDTSPVKVDRAKEIFNNLNGFDKQEYTGTEPLTKDTDLLIFCKKELNYEEKNGRMFNKAQGFPLPNDYREDVNLLFSITEEEYEAGEKTLQAMVFVPDEVKPSYYPIVDEWLRTKGPDDILPPEKTKDHLITHNDKPTTMDLTPGYLAFLMKDEDEELHFGSLSDANIAKVQDPGFIKDLADAGMKPIDGLGGSVALPGLFLHELAHTVQGGKVIDSRDPNGCYGWDCVKTVADVNNGDSIMFLGIGLHLFSKGLWVDNDGNVKKI